MSSLTLAAVMLCLSLLSIVAIAIYSFALAPFPSHSSGEPANLPRTTEPPAPASARPRRSLPPGQLAGWTRRRARHWRRRAACSLRARAWSLVTWCLTRCVGGICGRRRATLARRCPSLSECRRGEVAVAFPVMRFPAMWIWSQASGQGRGRRARLVPGGEIRAQGSGVCCGALIWVVVVGAGSREFERGFLRRGDVSDGATVQRPGLVQGGDWKSLVAGFVGGAGREVQGVKRILWYSRGRGRGGTGETDRHRVPVALRKITRLKMAASSPGCACAGGGCSGRFTL